MHDGGDEIFFNRPIMHHYFLSFGAWVRTGDLYFIYQSCATNVLKMAKNISAIHFASGIYHLQRGPHFRFLKTNMDVRNER
jgi:hypothetical protein